MSANTLNKGLHDAKRAKKDEFYTQLADIENEMRFYKEQFRGKVVYCNCDDPYESNFFKYFAMSFNHLGLKKLVATSYVQSPIAGGQVPLVEIEGLKPEGREPFKLEINEILDNNDDGAVDLTDVEWLLRHDANVATPLEGDGDFRSEECIEFLKEVDIVVTNPPFSLFKEYVPQLVEYGKKFLILGNQNAITYKEIFKFIKEDKLWLGYDNGGTKWFQVPDDYEIKTESRIRIENRIKYFSMGSVMWFTNLNTKKRHEDIVLWKKYVPEEFPKYDNYDVINVDKVSDIPIGYDGVMGVPITFLDKHNPEQFEILGIANSARWIGYECLTTINGKKVYNRILIKQKKHENRIT